MPRLYHTKSRTGCKRCRARRVKCDETWPTCGNCSRHQVQCTYDRLDASGNATPDTLVSPGSATGSKENPRAPSMAESRYRRQRELRLILAFTSQTAHTIAGTHLPELLKTWSIEVPNLALDFEPLHNAIMALTSHHLAHKAATQDERDEYLTMRSLYMASTLQKHRIALIDLSNENADAVSFTTAILTVDAFAYLQDRPLEHPDAYEPPLQWLQISRGMGRVCKLAMDLILGNPHAKIWPVMTTMMPYLQDANSFGNEAFAHLLHPQQGEILDPGDVEAYKRTTSILSWILQGRECGEHIKMFCRRLTIFPVLITDRFAELIEMQDSRALVMLAHFFALCSYASEVWWIGEMTGREINYIQACLEPEWQGMMAWPAQVALAQSPGRSGTGPLS